jgi:methionyl aminopeptidase
MTVAIKTEKEIEMMRKAGKALAEVMRVLEKEIRPGIDTLQLDKLAEELVLARGGKPAFKGYGDHINPFPATICASLNSEVVHGIPNESKILSEGDILKVDIGINLDGYFSDMARTFAVGEISTEANKLIDVTEKSFWKGIANLKDGAMLSSFSKTSQEYIESNGFSVVRNLVGHGIGTELHEQPQIPNYYEKGYRDMELKAGMTLAIEPMVNMGTFKTVLAADEWAYCTADGQLSAHYENTILITKKGVEVLTQ